MPAVSEILNTVKGLSLMGADETSADTQVLAYMNMVYKEVYRKTCDSAPTLFLEREDVTITGGAGVLSSRPYSVKAVKDTVNNSVVLDVTTLVDLEEKYPLLDDEGVPSWYYMSGAKAISTYPENDTTLSVRYVPSAATLTDTTTEDDVKIPPEFHDILVWGTLVYMGYDERDKAAMAEVNTAQSKYELALSDYMTWLAFSQARGVINTKAAIPT